MTYDYVIFAKGLLKLTKINDNSMKNCSILRNFVLVVSEMFSYISV